MEAEVNHEMNAIQHFMQLFLEAVDVWMFRDGRPFDAGQDHSAASRFPPYPTVVQGAVRSHHLVQTGVNLTDDRAVAAAVGVGFDLGLRRVRGPLLARRQGDAYERLFPAPADAFDQEGRMKARSPRPRPDGVTVNIPATVLPQLFWSEGEAQKGEGGGAWLTERALLDYLAGKAVRGLSSACLFEMEPRMGIGVDSTRRTAREGALYDLQVVRPRPGVGLWVEASGFEGWPDSGLMRIGGEGRGAQFSTLRTRLAWPGLAGADLPRAFKVYFATPTWFEHGWRPTDWGRFFEGQVSLQAAAIHRYESVGGFDWAAQATEAGAHRPARRFVPAGSVYLFYSDGPARLRADLVQNAITDWGAEIGFGQAIIAPA
jgi:CRISPR-associated protein Cmr3